MNNPFFNVLFDPGEFTCLTSSTKGIAILPVTAFKEYLHTFFSINPIDGTEDRLPTADYHAPDKPRRADINVTVYRNLLVEMDSIPLEEQQAVIAKLAMPYSTCVYSGGKSYHYIISLETPAATRIEYDALVLRLYKVLAGYADVSCKNPSRLSRCPDAFREDTQKTQEEIEVLSRVPNADFDAWLTSHGAHPESVKVPTPAPRISYPDGDTRYLSFASKSFLRHGAATGEWNLSLFKTASECFRASWTLEAFTEAATMITGHLDSNDTKTIASAYRAVERYNS